MILELLKYAKSVFRNFDQSEATFWSHMTTMEGQTVNLQYDPCNGYGQSFPKWYDTWWSAKNWGFQAIFKILESFFQFLSKF